MRVFDSIIKWLLSVCIDFIVCFLVFYKEICVEVGIGFFFLKFNL